VNFEYVYSSDVNGLKDNIENVCPSVDNVLKSYTDASQYSIICFMKSGPPFCRFSRSAGFPDPQDKQFYRKTVLSG
tara:strand:- start:8605 stop:8832 length:228 start_codon:yes stop_codon:yes gene_type:complete